MTALVYKILSKDEWQAARTLGLFEGSAVDRQDGYIHFSTAEQVEETAAKHFAGRRDLVLLAVAADALTDLRWEPSRGGALFPHLYAPLDVAAVASANDLPLAPDGRHLFPPLS